MIAPIRPPLVKPPRRPFRESPLERARRAVADSLLAKRDPGQGPRGSRWLFWSLAGTLLAAVLLLVRLFAER